MDWVQAGSTIWTYIENYIKTNVYKISFFAGTMFAAVVLIILAACSEVEPQPKPCKYSCDNNKPHSMCIYNYSIPSASCGDCFEIGMSYKDKEDILKDHNMMRHESVLTINDTDEVAFWLEHPLPAAVSKLNDLQWSDELHKIAQSWANQCSEENDECRDTLEMKVGQNVFSSKPQESRDRISTYMGTFRAWLEEFKELDVHEETIKKFEPTDRDTDRFTQIIWHETRFVGCGFVNCKKNKFFKGYLVCNYAPAGNIIGQPVYETV